MHDLTLLRHIRSLCAAFGLNLTGVRNQLDRWNQAAEVKHSDMWLQSHDWMQGGVHPIILIGASDRVRNAGSSEPMALFHGGFYVRPMAGSSSLSWPFALT
jgi:hypothetical protein